MVKIGSGEMVRDPSERVLSVNNLDVDGFDWFAVKL